MQRAFFYIIGLLILSLGISLTIVSGRGTSPFDALNVGLSLTVGLTVGSWEFISGGLLIFSNAWLEKKRPDVMALFTAFVTGVGIDGWLYVFRHLLGDPGIVFGFFLLLIGVACMSLGVSVYLQADFAPIPADGFMMALRNRFGMGMAAAKTIVNLVFLLFAIVFQGPIGWGTLAVVLLSGPLIGYFYPAITNVYDACQRLSSGRGMKQHHS